MDWKGMIEEARDIFWGDIKRSFVRFNSWILSLLLLPFLILGFYGSDYPLETVAIGVTFLIGIIGLRLHIARQERPGYGVLLAVEASIVAALTYGAGWLAAATVDMVA
jgi:hypothetical protein